MLIRPELAARIRPWLPALIAGAVTLTGLWMVSRGGWFFVPLGGATAAVGLAWLGVELNRRRLAGRSGGPGIVEIEEGAVRYWAPHLFGGEIALRDVIELRILRVGGHACWRLRSRDGQALLIPADAGGAGALADGFAALPGADLTRIADGLDRVAGGEASDSIVWTAHDGPGVHRGSGGHGGHSGGRPGIGGPGAAESGTAGSRTGGPGSAAGAPPGGGGGSRESSGDAGPGSGTPDGGSPTA